MPGQTRDYALVFVRESTFRADEFLVEHTVRSIPYASGQLWVAVTDSCPNMGLLLRA